jgi:putative flippase GtrA
MGLALMPDSGDISPRSKRDTRRVGCEFLSFAAVGAIGTLVHFIVLVVLVQNANASPVIASTAGFVGGAATNYVCNYYWTFRSTDSHASTMPRFFVVSTIGMGLNAAIMAMLSIMLTQDYLLSQAIATAGVLIWNFSANRLWTFGNPSRNAVTNLDDQMQ